MVGNLFFNAAQITFSIANESQLHLKPRLQNGYTTRLQNEKRFVVSKAFFFDSLASIEQKKQSEHCMKETQTHCTRFCAWYYEFCFCSHVQPGEKQLDCFTRKASKGRFLLLFVWAYFLFAASMRRTKT